MLRLLVVAVFFHIYGTTATPEETYDDEPMLYIATRGANKYSSERGRQLDEQRRSAIDKNFVRFGRGGGHTYFQPEDFEFDSRDDIDFADEFARPTRSQDKNDNFVRFGRGQSDFLRFGRNPYEYLRAIRGNDQNFLRFGRSTADSEKPIKRSRRDVLDKYAPDFKRNDRSSNFLRFGKGGNDNFMRFGRHPNDKIDVGPGPAPTEPFNKALSSFINGHRQSYPLSTRLLQNPMLLRFLAELNEELNQSNQ